MNWDYCAPKERKWPMWVSRRLHLIWPPKNSMRVVEWWSRIHLLRWSICVQTFPKRLRIEAFTLVVDTPVCRTVDTPSHHDGPRPREKHAVSIIHPCWLMIFHVGHPSENGPSNCIALFPWSCRRLLTDPSNVDSALYCREYYYLRTRTSNCWFPTTISIWLMILSLVFLCTPFSILIFAMYRNCLSALLQWNISILFPVSDEAPLLLTNWN